MKKLAFVVLIILTFSWQGFTQPINRKYWIAFSDKNYNSFLLSNPSSFLSQRAIERRNRFSIPIDEKDLPVSQFYIDSLKKLNLKVLNVSKWFNGITAEIYDSTTLLELDSIDFVKERKLIAKATLKSLSDTSSKNTLSVLNCPSIINYGKAKIQIELEKGQCIHQLGFTGKGMLITVIDVGFLNADTLKAFDSIFYNNQILATRNFVNPSISVYREGSHGMNVLSIIAAKDTGSLVGTAPDANFILLKSEDSGGENPIEEYNWIAAAEFADSLGTDVINTSLGYSIYDDLGMAYSSHDLNGEVAPISIGATIAAQKGMLVVVAAGNEGAKPWKFLTCPADAKNVLTVGAVNNLGAYASFSSVGPSYDRRVKPDIAALGVNVFVEGTNGLYTGGTGTSFAAPVIAGLAACLWQAVPNKTNLEIISAIQRSSSQNNAPDSLKGFGIPDFEKAYMILTRNNEFKNTNTTFNIFPNPFSDYFTIDVSEIKGAFNIELINGQGKIVLNQNAFRKTEDNYTVYGLSRLSKGLYVIRLSTSKGVVESKIIKL